MVLYMFYVCHRLLAVAVSNIFNMIIVCKFSLTAAIKFQLVINATDLKASIVKPLVDNTFSCIKNHNVGLIPDGFTRYCIHACFSFLFQGGLVFVLSKGCIKMYYKQQQYMRQAKRKIRDFPDIF